MTSANTPQADTGSLPAQLSRRSMLAVGAVGVSATALAGCAKAPSASSPGTSTAAPAGGGSSPTNAGPLAQLADIKVGEAIAATGPDGAKIIIARPTETTVAAFSAICTHQGCTVAPAGKQLDCPCHGSTYNATTGEVISGPARRALAKVNVAVSGTNVVAS